MYFSCVRWLGEWGNRGGQHHQRAALHFGHRGLNTGLDWTQSIRPGQSPLFFPTFHSPSYVSLNILKFNRWFKNLLFSLQFQFKEIVLTEEEKRLLSKEGATIPTHMPLTKVIDAVKRLFTWTDGLVVKLLWMPNYCMKKLLLFIFVAITVQ